MFENSQRKYYVYSDSTIEEAENNAIFATFPSGKTVALTESNFTHYLGYPITNYKSSSSSGSSSGTSNETSVETISVDSNQYKISTNYKLYYIDYDNKYGDGPGTIYLKADYSSANVKYVLQSNGNINTSKIRQLNPSLFAEGVTSPSLDNLGMKKAIWLLDTEKWTGLLKSGEDTEIEQYINYVVGAPSIELLIDSYNAHYGLTGDEPDLSIKSTATSPRVKLFYRYNSSSKNGYQVGPNYQNKKQFHDFTSDYSIKSDPEADPLFYPNQIDPDNANETRSYYIASPTNKDKNQIMRVLHNNGGFISYCPNNNTANVFCPIVSVSANCPIKFGDY